MLYQQNLSALETQFNECKTKSQQEIASWQEQDCQKMERIEVLQQRLEATTEELNNLKAALGKAGMVYVDGKVKPAS